MVEDLQGAPISHKTYIFNQASRMGVFHEMSDQLKKVDNITSLIEVENKIKRGEQLTIKFIHEHLEPMLNIIKNGTESEKTVLLTDLVLKSMSRLFNQDESQKIKRATANYLSDCLREGKEVKSVELMNEIKSEADQDNVMRKMTTFKDADFYNRKSTSPSFRDPIVYYEKETRKPEINKKRPRDSNGFNWVPRGKGKSLELPDGAEPYKGTDEYCKTCGGEHEKDKHVFDNNGNVNIEEMAKVIDRFKELDVLRTKTKRYKTFNFKRRAKFNKY